MLSSLSQLAGGRGTYVEFTRGSLSVVEDVKGSRLIGRAWWGREMGQSGGWQDVSPLLMVTVKNGQVPPVWEDDTSPRAELEPPRNPGRPSAHATLGKNTTPISPSSFLLVLPVNPLQGARVGQDVGQPLAEQRRAKNRLGRGLAVWMDGGEGRPLMTAVK